MKCTTGTDVCACNCTNRKQHATANKPDLKFFTTIVILRDKHNNVKRCMSKDIIKGKNRAIPKYKQVLIMPEDNTPKGKNALAGI